MPICTDQPADPASMQGPLAEVPGRGTPDATRAGAVHVRCGHTTGGPGRSDMPDTEDLYGGPGNAPSGNVGGTAKGLGSGVPAPLTTIYLPKGRDVRPGANEIVPVNLLHDLDRMAKQGSEKLSPRQGIMTGKEREGIARTGRQHATRCGWRLLTLSDSEGMHAGAAEAPGSNCWLCWVCFRPDMRRST